MPNRKLIFLFVCSTLVGSISACQHKSDVLAGIEVLPNEYLIAASEPVLLARDLNNPMSPRLVDGRVVYAESGAGEVRSVSLEDGAITQLISGFGMDSYAGYDVSVQGITIDPRTNQWIVSAAEGSGRVLLFDPSSFPTDVRSGRDIEIQGGSAEDNPVAAVIAGDILIVSSGTSKAYQGPFVDQPVLLTPALEVETGIIGIAVDPASGDVFGAVFGSTRGDGSIIRWDPSAEKPEAKTVASGFNNLVDVAFTSDGLLLALEFGDLGGAGKGAVYIVATDDSGQRTPFIRGLRSPTNIHVTPNQQLLVTEFGTSINGQQGTLIALQLKRSDRRQALTRSGPSGSSRGGLNVERLRPKRALNDIAFSGPKVFRGLDLLPVLEERDAAGG